MGPYGNDLDFSMMVGLCFLVPLLAALTIESYLAWKLRKEEHRDGVEL
jgi:hypothetical protein